MKILYVSASKIPSRAANSIHVMKMCHAWASAGHEVVLLTQHEKEYYEADIKDLFSFYGVEKKFKIVRLPSFSKNLVFAHFYGVACALYTAVFRPDLVYGREASGLFWSSLLGYPSAFEVHNPETLKGFYPRKLVGLKRLKFLVVISEKLKLIATNYVNNKSILVAHDGADADITNLSEKQKLNLGLLKHSDNYNVGYTGHLYPGKGAEAIIEIAKRLPGVIFHIFGGEENDICRLKVGAPSNLLFHGFIPQSAVPFVQQQMDLLLLPAQKKVAASGYEKTGAAANISDFMSPLKLFEYMRAAKPIVASDIPVLHEVLKDGWNALLCDPENVIQWVNAITRLRDEKELSAIIAQHARADFIREYSWQARADKILCKFSGYLP